MKRQRRSLPICLIAVVIIAGCNAETGNQQKPGRDVIRSNSSMEAGAGGGQLVNEVAAGSIASKVHFSDGKLSVSIEKVPLHQLTTEVAKQSGVDIRLIGEYPNSSITAKFTDSPLEMGLNRLLGELNTIFIYADTDADGNNNGQLVRVLILPDGENSNLATGMKPTDELVSKISEHLQIYLPQSYDAANLDDPMIDPVMDQALFELGESLTNQISDTAQEPN